MRAGGVARTLRRMSRLLALLLFLSLSIPSAHAAGVSPTEENVVLSRVANRVTDELAQYFDTILYVSKAPSGPLAQHMFVFEKDADGSFRGVEKFAVSTGRERKERYFTGTPDGVFQLDSTRLVRLHHSKVWDNAPMPYTMFLNVAYRNGLTGIALHAAYGKANVRKLGSRASGGCVRMPPGKAKQLFEEIEAGRHTGLVPEFVFDPAYGGTNDRGEMLRGYSGQPVLRRGITVLLVIENYSGKGAVAETARRQGAG